MKDSFKKIYTFIFHDDSALSWIVNIVLAFLLVKFIIYPGLALLLGSSLPLVAVISGSMEHEGFAFDAWWEANGQWYEEQSITKEMFLKEHLLCNTLLFIPLSICFPPCIKSKTFMFHTPRNYCNKGKRTA